MTFSAVYFYVDSSELPTAVLPGELVLQLAGAHRILHATLHRHLQRGAVLLKQEVKALGRAGADHKHGHGDVDRKAENRTKRFLISRGASVRHYGHDRRLACHALHGAVRVLPLLEEPRGSGHAGSVVPVAAEQQQVAPQHPLRHRTRVVPLLSVDQRLEQVQHVVLREERTQISTTAAQQNLMSKAPK